MPDCTNTWYYYAKFPDIRKTSLKNMPYCDESFSDLLSQCNVSLSSLNLNTLETGAQNQLYLKQYETHQKKLYCQLQRNQTSTDTKLCARHPQVIAICGKPDTRTPNWQDFKCGVQVPRQVKSISPVENYITEEPTDGSSTSKSSSSCDKSDICHSSHTSNKHSRNNSKDSNRGNTSAGTSNCQSGGDKGQKKGVKLLEPQGKNPTCNSNVSARKCRPRDDESYGQPRKLLNSERPRLRSSPATDTNKQHSEKPVVPIPKLPRDKVGCRVMPHQNGAQNSVLSTKTEMGNNANYQIDPGKYDDTARLEIFKLRNRIKRYTEGSDNPMLRKCHTARAQNLNSPVAKILMPKTQTVPDCRSGYQSLSCPKSQVQCTKHPPLIQKSVPQMLHTAPVKKKRRTFEIGDQLPEKQTENARFTTPADISSTGSDSRSRESSGKVSMGTEPYIRDGAVQCPTHLGTKRTIYRKENSSAKSIPQHTQIDAAEQCTKQYHGNCQLEPKSTSLKRNQLRRPVPGQRPLYNYEQLPYQASEVYPDLICELEEKLSAINSQHSSGKSLGPLSK